MGACQDDGRLLHFNNSRGPGGGGEGGKGGAGANLKYMHLFPDRKKYFRSLAIPMSCLPGSPQAPLICLTLTEWLLSPKLGRVSGL